MTNDASSVAVMGGGVTGLAAAYALARQGRRVRLFESTDRFGGVVQTEISPDGWLIEAGPTSLLLGDPKVVNLLSELGLDSELLRSDRAAKNRYVVRNGRPLPLPTSPGELLSTKLFSARAKFRLLYEFLKRPRRRTTDISLAVFMEAHFGREIVNYGLQPFVSGVYAGNAAKLSAKHAFPQVWEWERKHGSLIRGQRSSARARKERGEERPEIVSFKRGLQSIPDALASRIPAGSIELNAKVETLIRDGGWKVVWSRNRVAVTESFAAIVLALPAQALARLVVGTLGERPFASLESLEYPPVASLALGYRRRQISHALNGFGMLVPAVEKRDILGVLFTSTLFPGRAPEGHAALTVMLGGALRPDLGRLERAEALTIAERELGLLLGVQGEPTMVRYRVWPRAIPQYQIGHERFIDSMVRGEADHPGLLVGGHVRDGISVPACLTAGLHLAERAAGFLRRGR